MTNRTSIGRRWDPSAPILFLALTVSHGPRLGLACILLLNGWTPLGLRERTEQADIVLVGRALRSFKDTRTPDSNTYTAEFELISALKGRRDFRHVVPGSSDAAAAVMTRYNVSNFGDRSDCYSDVTDGDDYVMFLTTFERRLSAKYDDLFGALQERTREAEEEVLEALGWKPWSDWESCSLTCGVGVQQRIRFCNLKSAEDCEGETSERRNCNIFSCKGAKDLLSENPDMFSNAKRLTHRQSAFNIDHTTSLNVPTSKVFPLGLPATFALFASFRSKPDSEGYLLTVNNLLGTVEFGVKVGGAAIVVEFSDGSGIEPGSTEAAVFDDAEAGDGRWRQMALGVGAERLELVLNCELQPSRTLRRKRNASYGESTVISIGKAFIESRKYPRFQGDLEQLTFIPGLTSISEHSCSSTSSPLSSSYPDDAEYKEEKEKTSTTATQAPEALRSKTRTSSTSPVDSNGRRFVWSKWSPCSATCGMGVQARVSYCSNMNDECRPGTTQTKSCVAKMSKCPDVCRRTCRNGGICQTCYTISNTLKVSIDGTSNPSAKDQSDGRCRCVLGYRGRYCHTAVCDPPCLNGGRCVRPGRCSCPIGFAASDCSQALCTVECYNGGTCIGFNVCKCPPGYHGNQCNTAICERGCENGGRCVGPNACSCPLGFTGKHCQTPICNPQCLNGGVCALPHLCLCPPGTYGSLCERFICSPRCINGGSCIGLNTCICSSDYSGLFCQMKNCPDGCNNGGSCIGPKTCACPVGFNGSRCENRHCREEIVHEPYERILPKLFKTNVSFQCGAFGMKTCNRTRYEYRMVHRTLYRTIVKCI